MSNNTDLIEERTEGPFCPFSAPRDKDFAPPSSQPSFETRESDEKSSIVDEKSNPNGHHNTVSSHVTTMTLKRSQLSSCEQSSFLETKKRARLSPNRVTLKCCRIKVELQPLDVLGELSPTVGRSCLKAYRVIINGKSFDGDHVCFSLAEAGKFKALLNLMMKYPQFIESGFKAVIKLDNFSEFETLLDRIDSLPDSAVRLAFRLCRVGFIDWLLSFSDRTIDQVMDYVCHLDGKKTTIISEKTIIKISHMMFHHDNVDKRKLANCLSSFAIDSRYFYKLMELVIVEAFQELEKPQQKNAFQFVCQGGRIGAAKVILRHMDDRAFGRNKAEIKQLLINAMTAAVHSKNVELVKMLIDYWCVKRKLPGSPVQNTEFLSACLGGDFEMLLYLLTVQNIPDSFYTICSPWHVYKSRSSDGQQLGHINVACLLMPHFVQHFAFRNLNRDSPLYLNNPLFVLKSIHALKDDMSESLCCQLLSNCEMISTLSSETLFDGKNYLCCVNVSANGEEVGRADLYNGATLFQYLVTRFSTITDLLHRNAVPDVICQLIDQYI